MIAALFPSAFHPSLGGVEELTRQLALQLKSRGRAPLIIANRWPRNLPAHEIIDGLDVRRAAFRVPCGNWRPRVNYALTTNLIRRKVARWVDGSPADVVHIQCVSGGALYALHARRALRLPLVVTLQGELTMDADRIFERDAFSQNIMRQSLQEADVITACSAKTLADGEAFFGRPFGSRGRVIFNGARVEDYAGAQPYSHARPYLLAIGRLVKQKGFDVLIRAMQKIEGADLLIAGDGTERRSLEDLVGELRLNDRVRFVGRADRATAASLYAGAALVVVPSRADEGLPVVIAEALAAGKAIVATRVGGVPEAITHGQSGLLVEREDCAALTGAINTLLESPEQRAAFAANARQRSAAFAWPAITDQYEQAYADAFAVHSNAIDSNSPAPQTALSEAARV